MIKSIHSYYRLQAFIEISMAGALYHSNHQAIQKTLYSLNILDTPLEERFERITRLVCITLGVPISAFSLIDGERQWFKSIQGLSATENTRAESFCAYTILGDDVMVVPDAHKDKRFANNPLVKGDPSISFYAGCPVRAPDGRNIGSLCAIDNKAKIASPEQIQALKDLAQMIESELKVAQLSKAQYDLIHELDAAHRLALIDEETRAWNSKGLADILKREMAASLRKNAAVTIMAVEIDDIELRVEQLGYNGRSQLLKEVAKRLLTALRGEDTLARTEKNKFVLVLPQCAKENLLDTAKRIQDSVTAKPIQAGREECKITLSFGVAQKVPDMIFTGDDLVSVAERALKKASDLGRSAIEIEEF